MDATQDRMRNPFGMDEECPNCPALCEARTNVVHGYGDVTAEFLFVRERPTANADAAGVPFTGDDDDRGRNPDGQDFDNQNADDRDADTKHAADRDADTQHADERLLSVLVELGFHEPSALDADGNPVLDNAFVTHLTRCRDPSRRPTDEEIATCEPFLNAEIRMINPEIIVPVGERALTEIATEYTTKPADGFDVERDHGRSIRGRGFELVPMVGLDALTDDRAAAFVDALAELMGRDYRQTKGRQGR